MSYAEQLEELFPPRCPEEKVHRGHLAKVVKESGHKGTLGKIITTQTGINKTSHLVELPDGTFSWFQEQDLIECCEEGPDN